MFVVPKNYETAYFLNSEEKAIMRRRAEEMEAYSGGTGHYGKQEIKQAAKDVKSWMHGVIQIGVVTILYGKFSTSYWKMNQNINSYGKALGPFCPSLSRKGFITPPSKHNI